MKKDESKDNVKIMNLRNLEPRPPSATFFSAKQSEVWVRVK